VSIAYPRMRDALADGDLGAAFGRFKRFALRHRPLWPAALLTAAGLLAYHFTLLSLADYLRLDTPLAYLPLLPLVTAATVYVKVQQHRHSAQPIQDRQTDYLVGVPLMAAALVLITVVPAAWSTYYWSERPDVISLALFVSAGVILFYGFNWFWRLRGPLLFLFLMWPALYLHAMAGILDAFTNATNGALGQVVQHLPLGVTPGGGPGLLLITVKHAAPILISVGTACSGANSVLGFLLLGSASLLGVTGRRGAKLLWLAAGLALTFVLNVVRLTSILALASAGNPSLALGGYHTVIGLVLFSGAVTLMMLALPWFRLEWGTGTPRAAAAGSGQAARPLRIRRVPLVLFALVTLVLTAADQDLRAYASFADGTGAPTVTAFGSVAAGTGARLYKVATYPWATQYFGANSDFSRWSVVTPGEYLMWADVVRTDDRGSLDAYNLTNCFLFHNYDITTSRRVDLGNGVTGLLLNYSDPSTRQRWATVSWAWPVRYKATTYYERVALTSSLVVGSQALPDVRPGDGMRTVMLDVWNALGSSKFSSVPDKAFRPADDRLQDAATGLVAATLKKGGG